MKVYRYELGLVAGLAIVGGSWFVDLVRMVLA